MIPPAALAMAEAHAAQDRDTLARLMVAGKVGIEPAPSGLRREANVLQADVERRVNGLTGKRVVNLAIRPKRRKGRR